MSVKFNGYDCHVTNTTASSVTCITSPRTQGIRRPGRGPGSELLPLTARMGA